MSETPAQSLDYCTDLLRREDEDRWLAAQYAKSSLRDVLIGHGAMRLEFRRIPAQVSEAPLGEMRLQWWRERLEGLAAGVPPRAHPVLEALAPTLAGRNITRLDGVIDACSRPLYDEAFSSVEELAGWLMESEGAMDAFVVELLGGDTDLTDAVMKAGAAYAMAREGRFLAQNFDGEIGVRAASLYAEAAPVLRKATLELTPAFLHLTLTPFYLQVRDRAAPVRKRIHLFSAMAFGRF